MVEEGKQVEAEGRVFMIAILITAAIALHTVAGMMR